MADHLLRDKIVNLENEVNNLKLQLFQQELILADVKSAGESPDDDSNPVANMTYAKLVVGYVDAASQAAVLKKKIANREPLLKDLKEEQTRLDAEVAAKRTE